MISASTVVVRLRADAVDQRRPCSKSLRPRSSCISVRSTTRSPSASVDVGELPAQALLAAQHVDHPHALALEDARRSITRCADQRRALGHHDLGEELHPLAGAEQVGHRVAVGQEARHEEPHGREADDGDDDAERRDLEEAEGRHALGAGDAVDEDVGRGADHGDHAAEHGQVGERDQELGRREAHRVGELHRDRDHHRDERRVVGEGRGDGDEDARRGSSTSTGCGPAWRDSDAGDAVDEPGADQPARDDEHRGDRPGRRVGEDLEHARRTARCRRRRAPPPRASP